MKKKVLLIILPIILVIAIVAAIIVAVIVNKNKEEESTGSKWGDTYYAYLKEAVNEDDLTEAEEKYGVMLGMKNSKIQFCEVEEGQDPTMIMTYEKENSSYVNVYQITDKKKVNYIAYKQPSEVEYLYNIEKDEYSWYIHGMGTDSDSYSSLKNISETLKNSSTQSEDSKNVNIAELEADYTIKKDEATTTQETADGESISLDKFDEIFVKPDIKQNIQIDFNADIKEKDLKNEIKSAVESYKKDSKRITDEIKESVANKVEEVKNKKEQIASAKIDLENKKKAEEYSKGLKVGNATLKYGVYTYTGEGGYTPGQTLKGEITLKPEGKFHIKSNFDDMSAQAASYDEDGTYTIELDRDDGYGGKSNYIRFKGDKGYSMVFDVYKDNSFSDQWHFYNLTTETKVEVPSTNTSNGASSSSANSSGNSHLTAFEYDESANNKVAEGDYYRDKGTGYEGILKIKNSTGNSFEFSIDAIYTSVAGSPNIGQIEGTAKAVKGGRFVFSTKEGSETGYGYEYNIFFKIGENGEITIEDECYMNQSGKTEVNPVAGHNVTFEGIFTK
ncbi:MAG: hypothetical protein IJH12_08245 [Clostridia bacterium]|nr:hypothetical protein [Clostridia bacterium]